MIARGFTIRAALMAMLVVVYGTTLALAQDKGTPAPKTGITPGVSPVPDEKLDAKRKTDCQHFAEVLSGKKTNSALLDTAEVKALARQVPDLVACGAVLQDSDELCKKLFKGESTDGTTSGFVPEGPYNSCRSAYSDFHELRAYPKGRSFMFNDVNLQNCKTAKEMEPLCDGIRAAMRTGDESKCGTLGSMEAICRAHIKLDKSLCQAPKGNAFFDEHGAEIAKDCARRIDSKAILAKGLKSVAESGAARERELAKAALKEPDACGPFVQKATEICTAAGAGSGTGAAADKSGSKPAPAK